MQVIRLPCWFRLVWSPAGRLCCVINNRHTDGLLGLPGFRPSELQVQMYLYLTCCLTNMQTKHFAITVINCVNGHQTIMRNRAVPQGVKQLLTACCTRICNTSQLYILLIGHHCSSAMHCKLKNKVQMLVKGLTACDGSSRLGLTSEWECPDKVSSWKLAVTTA